MKHDEKKEYTVRPIECSTRPIHYDPKLCIGCNRCGASSGNPPGYNLP